MRQVHHVVQGSDEWLALRREYNTASEANGMMGTSAYETRDQMLERYTTGVEKEITPFQQKLFDDGHAAEKAIQPFIEDLIGQELFPSTISDVIDGLPLLASFDNITMLEDDAAEVKLWNKKLADHVAVGEVPETHFWQLEQQCLIGGFESMLFVVTDGTPEKTVWTRYHSDPARRKKLIAGWKQFAEDLKTYQPKSAPVQAVADPVMDLPAVSVQVSGALDIQHNFDLFEQAARDFVDKRLITKPKTDQDFATLEQQIKTMKKAESALDAAEAHFLSQIESVDNAKRRKDMLKTLIRDNRLMAEKLLEAEKKARRLQIKQDGEHALQAHINNLNQRLGKPYMPVIVGDFAGVMKGKKTITSLESAVSDEIMRCKLEANEIADKLELNLKTLADLAAEHDFLFADKAQIINKANDDLVALIKTRIADHKAAEEKKAEELREQIRKEEEARAQEKATQQQTIAPAVRHASKVEAPDAETTKVLEQYVKTSNDPERPSDSEILSVLAKYFGEPEPVIIYWLMKMDLEAMLEAA